VRPTARRSPLHNGLRLLRCAAQAWQCEVADGASGALQVVELYADWAGPCKAVKELFRKLYFDHGDGGATGVPLKFYTVR
jgi:hypothetical protein